ncbi:MAG: dihydrofolate reductase family protein [Nitrosopumilus sp.]|nr:dihydrofolate reductase family protein [Nitrosopumilus sp.]
MRKIILYIATSLDGFIARKNGSVDWLTLYSNTEEDFGYREFLNSVGTVILGNTTYKGFKAPYENKKCFVFSRKNSGTENNITYVNQNVKEFLEDLDDDENIWLVGGAEITKEFLKNNLIDEFIITVIPIVLGEGIPLFAKGCGEHVLKLQDTKSFDSGVVQLYYRI